MAIRTLFSLLCIVVGVIAGFSQERPEAAGEPAGPERLLALHRNYLDSAAAVRTTDLKKSIDYITQSIAILNGQGYDREIAASLTTLGEVYLYHGQTDLAIANLEEASDLYGSSRNALELGRAYLLNREFEKAEKLLLPLVEATSLPPIRRVLLYEILGDIYSGMGKTNEALPFYKEGLVIADKNQLASRLIDLNSKIAEAYAKADRPQEARAYFDNSMELAEKQAPGRAVREKEKAADFFNSKKEYEEEIALRKKSLDVLREQPAAASRIGDDEEAQAELSPQGIAYKIANAYIAQDRFDEAISYLKESIGEAVADNDLMIRKDATRTLSEVYREKGDFNKALASYQDYVNLVDSLYRRKEQELAQIARFNREIAEKQSRITGLEQERELSKSRMDLALSEQQLIRERNNSQQLIIYSLILGIILLALTAYFFYRSNRQQKLANNLLALKSLRSQMNPHFIFNALNSVNNFISQKDERSANRYLSEFSMLMRAVLETSEQDFITLAQELEMIERYLMLEKSRFPDKFDYKVTVEGNLDPEQFRLPPMLLQPFIENAIWHGLRYKEEKGYLKVQLKAVDSTLRIQIIDNGIGRSRSAELKTGNQRKQRSQGMENIRKRIAILNSMYPDELAVSVNDLEEDGSGTLVELTIKKGR